MRIGRTGFKLLFNTLLKLLKKIRFLNDNDDSNLAFYNMFSAGKNRLFANNVIDRHYRGRRL